MSRKRHSAKEVINKLRQADVELGKGNDINLDGKVDVNDRIELLSRLGRPVRLPQPVR